MGLATDGTMNPSKDTVDTAAQTQGARRRAAKKRTPRQDPARYALDLATTAVDAFTLTAPQAFEGAIRGAGNQIADLVQGEGFSAEPWKEGMSKAYQMSREARDRLSIGDTVAAQIVGGMTPMGAPSMIDDIVRLPFNKQVAPTLTQRFVQKPLGAAAGGAVVNTLEGLAQGETSMEEMITNGTLGALIGPVAQAVVGDVALPLLARGGRSIGIFDDFGGAVDRLRDSPMFREGFTMQNMLEAADELPPTGRFLDLDVGGPRIDAAEPSRRMYNAMADLHFGKATDYKSNIPQFLTNHKEYARTLEAAERYAKEADDNARAAVDTALGNPTSRADALYKTNAPLERARQIMGDMRNERPLPDGTLPLGATPIDARAFIQETAGDVAERQGLNSIASDKELGRMFDKFTDELRILDMEPAALGVQMRPSQGTSTIGVSGEDVYEGANLSRLLRARTNYANKYLGPNLNVDKAQRAHATAILKSIDEEIAKLTAGGDELARKSFAKQMKMQEAYDMGQHFYTSRSGEMGGVERFADNYGGSLDDYLNNPDVDEEVKEMFRAGFRSGMSQNIGERGFLTEMKYFVGDYTSKPGQPTFFRQNDRGVEQLKQVLGPEEAQTILDVFENGQYVAEYSSKLADLIAAKGGNPKMQADIIGTGTEALSSKRSNPKDGVWDATLAGLDYILNPSDRQKVRALQKLLSAEGDEVRKYLQRGARQSGNLPLTVGSKLTQSMETAIFGDESEQIEDYLSSLDE